MAEIRFTINFEVSYDVDMDTAQEYYGTVDQEEMLAIDVENFKQDPWSLLSDIDPEDVTVTGKITGTESS